MWEFPLETQQQVYVANTMLDQATKPELSQYIHDTLFSLTTAIIIKAIELDFLKTWSGLTEQLINKQTEKLINTSMGNLHLRRRGLQPTR